MNTVLATSNIPSIQVPLDTDACRPIPISHFHNRPTSANIVIVVGLTSVTCNTYVRFHLDVQESRVGISETTTRDLGDQCIELA